MNKPSKNCEQTELWTNGRFRLKKGPENCKHEIKLRPPSVPPPKHSMNESATTTWSISLACSVASSDEGACDAWGKRGGKMFPIDPSVLKILRHWKSVVFYCHRSPLQPVPFSCFLFLGKTRGRTKPPKIQKCQKTPRSHERFRKVRANFCLLLCDMSQDVTRNCSEKLVQMNSFISGGFSFWDNKRKQAFLSTP